jgi:hypothetical protein
MKWVEENLLGVELEISSKPPTTEAFAPVKWRWVRERTFGTFSFFPISWSEYTYLVAGLKQVGYQQSVGAQAFITPGPKDL